MIDMRDSRGIATFTVRFLLFYVVGRVQLSVYPSFCLKGLMHDE